MHDFTEASRRTDASLKGTQHVPATALQQAQALLRAALAFACDRLDEREHRVFVNYACALVSRDAARRTRAERDKWVA